MRALFAGWRVDSFTLDGEMPLVKRWLAEEEPRFRLCYVHILRHN